jgi:hypothetical protein
MKRVIVGKFAVAKFLKNSPIFVESESLLWRPLDSDTRQHPETGECNLRSHLLLPYFLNTLLKIFCNLLHVHRNSFKSSGFQTDIFILSHLCHSYYMFC